MAKTLFTWVTVGDKSVCIDCVHNGGMESQTIKEWQSSVGLPRTGNTLCLDKCRCSLLPTTKVVEEQVDISQYVEDMIDRMMAGVRFDKMNGGAILLKDFRDATGLKKLNLEDAAEFEDIFNEIVELISMYNISGNKLPKEYYAIPRLVNKLKWLRENVS